MSWLGRIVAALLVTGLALAAYQLAGGSGPIGSERMVGKAAPEFAAPLAGSGLAGDANVFTRAEVRRTGKTAACDVKLTGAFVSCRGLAGTALLSFFDASTATCVDQVDVLDRFAARHRGQVRVAAVALRPEGAAVDTLRRKHRWEIPVAVDHDGVVGVLYRVAACPTTFILRDGTVRAVRIGLLDEEQLAAGLAAGMTPGSGATGPTG